MRCNGSNWAVYSPGSWDGFRNDVWALWAGVIMRLEHHLVGGYVRYISPYIIIIIISTQAWVTKNVTRVTSQKCYVCMFEVYLWINQYRTCRLWLVWLMHIILKTPLAPPKKKSPVSGHRSASISVNNALFLFIYFFSVIFYFVYANREIHATCAREDQISNTCI